MTDPSTQFSELRKKAESVLRERLQDEKRISAGDVLEMMDEIQVFQVELELQNEELRTAQKELEASRDRFSRLFNEAPVGYLVLDGAGMIAQANHTIARMLETGLNGLLNRPVSEFIHGRDQAHFHSRFKAFFKKPEGKTLALRMVRRKGPCFHARLQGRTMTPDPADRDTNEIHLMLMISDITREKEAEETLARHEAELRATVYSMGDAVITTDETGRIRRMNAAAEVLTRWTESDAADKSLDAVLTSLNNETWKQEPSLAAVVLGAKAPQKLKRDTLLVSRHGKKIPVSETASPIFDGNGRITGLVAVLRDCTQENLTRRMLEIRLELIEFSVNHSPGELLTLALDRVGELVDSPIGFYHFVEEDQRTLSLQQWSTHTLKTFCKAEGKGLHYDIDNAGVWADCVHTHTPLIHNDYAALPHKKGMPDGHAVVIRELVVPVMRQGKVTAIMGVGNKPGDYTPGDVEIVSCLADVTWEIICRKQAENGTDTTSGKE